MLTPLRRLDAWIERRTALPSWAIAMQLVGGLALVIALIGFVWDVGWHADLGRDKNLLTIPHLMILFGLFGLGAAGAAGILMATVADKPTRWRWWRLRIPFSAAALTALGAGAVAGFPIDDLWHRTYGIDVTMWSPTHLLMIGGASLSPIALALATGEAGGAAAGRFERARRYLLAGAVMVGLSTFQLEFDMGVPQWQALYQPVLIVAAAAIGLVAARAWLGRGGAVYAALVFLGMRAALLLLVGPVLGHAPARFPIYLAGAVAIELVFLLAPRLAPLPLAIAAGLASLVAELPVEWALTHLWGAEPWQARLLPDLWVAALASLAGAVVGLAMGRAWRPASAGLPRWAVAVAALALVAALAVPLPRTSASISVDLAARPAGPALGFAADRSGIPTVRQDFWIDARLRPAGAADGPDWFRVAAWQGGQVRDIDMVATGEPGHYRSSRPVPAGGTWKAILFLARGPLVVAAPVTMPRDAEFGQPFIAPPTQGETRDFVPASRLLMSEAHSASPLVADIAYAMFALIAAGWVLLLAACHRAVARLGDPADDLVERAAAPTARGARRRVAD